MALSTPMEAASKIGEEVVDDVLFLNLHAAGSHLKRKYRVPRIRANSDLPAVLMPAWPIVTPNTQPRNELLDQQ